MSGETDITSTPEPSGDQCASRAPVTVDGRPGFCCWYPSMGGYVGKAICVLAEGGCFDVLVWHNGEFPFPGEGSAGLRGRRPVKLHLSDPDDFVWFGESLKRFAESEVAG